MVSSVTNITGSPAFTAVETAFSTLASIVSSDQSSAKRRIGDEPMKAQVSIGTPASTEAWMAPSTSAG